MNLYECPFGRKRVRRSKDVLRKETSAGRSKGEVARPVLNAS